MFVTNWISTTKIQKISEITNFFRHYFLSRTEVIIWFFEAFALTGRQVCKHIYPGRCPGLGASALSGRIGCNNFQTKKSPHKFRHLSPGLWGELVSDNFMISIDAIAHGLSPSVP